MMGDVFSFANVKKQSARMTFTVSIKNASDSLIIDYI